MEQQEIDRITEKRSEVPVSTHRRKPAGLTRPA
jgi:hypothetical protein